MTETKISNLIRPALNEHNISFTVVDRKTYTLGEIISYVAEQALRKVKNNMNSIPEN